MGPTMKRIYAAACLTLTMCATCALGQSLSERISAVKEQRREAAQQPQTPPQDTLQIPLKMRRIIEEVFIDFTPARDVFDWWSSVTDIPLVINWNAMELEGIDPEQMITLDLKTVPARLLLDVLMRQASPEVELIYEATPWYVRVMTKRQANRHPVLKVYDISDMIVLTPNFTNAPSFDLSDALSNTSSGGGGGGGGGGGSSGLFTEDEEDDEEDQPTRIDRGQNLADMIRSTIEPDIWQGNGGLFASVRYYDGRLIVNAPNYVHKQIGIPVAATGVSNLGHVLPASPSSTVGRTSPPSSSKPFGNQAR
jgi:hypothetical protein